LFTSEGLTSLSWPKKEPNYEFWAREEESEPEDPFASRQEDFTTYEGYEKAENEYQTSKVLHKQRQQQIHEQVMQNINAEAADR